MGSKKGEKMKKQAVAVVKQKNVAVIQDNSPASMIRAAAGGKLDLDKLEKYLNMQKDWESNEARKLFNASFTKAQKEIEGVEKTKNNSHTQSKYADLGDIIESAKPVYTKYGFAIIFYEGESKKESDVRVCADVLHEAGHKETYHYDIPLDGVGIQGNANMTKIHGKASSTSYGRRYLMCMIWNIPTQDDNDGNGSKKPVVIKPEPNKPVVSKPAVKPENLTGKDGGNPTTTKGLPEVVKSGFAKAEKALGKEKFYEIIGQQGYEKIEQIINEGVARQILRDMETAYQTMQKNGGK
jgi:hypothetical protein